MLGERRALIVSGHAADIPVQIITYIQRSYQAIEVGINNELQYRLIEFPLPRPPQA